MRSSELFTRLAVNLSPPKWLRFIGVSHGTVPKWAIPVLWSTINLAANQYWAAKLEQGSQLLCFVEPLLCSRHWVYKKQNQDLRSGEWWFGFSPAHILPPLLSPFFSLLFYPCWKTVWQLITLTLRLSILFDTVISIWGKFILMKLHERREKYIKTFLLLRVKICETTSVCHRKGDVRLTGWTVKSSSWEIC
jgi:hypothetical protein